MTTSTHICADEEVMTASKKALESGRITPLLKVELWAKIQARRLSEGKEEMQVDFEKSPHSSNVLKNDLEERNLQLKAQIRELEKEKFRLTEKLLGNVGVLTNHIEEPVQIPAMGSEMTMNTTCIMTEFNNCEDTSVNMCEIQMQQETYDALDDVEDKTDSHDTIEYSRAGDDQGDIEDLTYFRSSQEVPTDSCSEIQMEERAPTNITSPLPEFEDGDASLDDWMGTSYINLDKYIL
ncbi:uncharacterized protein LOC134694873 isoform X2 [Mytilus trossulus]|uniref:uncharacterized protein LOC134694873 isoform X2 n=1 Tax=Mytilus trossulus TaxID=6551 RepID=UPI0030042B5E